MMIHFRSDLAFAIFGEVIVILDIHANRYLQLPPRLVPLFLAVFNGAGDALSAADKQRLHDAHLLSSEPAATQLNGSDIRVATTCIEPDGHAPIPGYAVYRAALSKLITMGSLRFLPFVTVTARLRAMKARRCAQSDENANVLREIVTAFQASTQILSDVERCLPSSMALAAALWKAGLSAQLVLGVRVSPFLAHCWVQWGDVVLNDHIDHVRSFKPILVI